MFGPLVDKKLVLKLNRLWRPIAVESVRDAFINLSKGNHSVAYILYADKEDGSPDYSRVEHIEFISFEKWLSFDGRPCDRWVRTGTSSAYGYSRIRVPTVIMALDFEKEFIRKPLFNFDALWERDQGRCCWTGKELERHEADIEHLIPTSKGGKTTWENCAIAEKRLNNLKGDMMPEEFSKKYNLLSPKPSIPGPIVVAESIRNIYDIPDWDHFIKR